MSKSKNKKQKRKISKKKIFIFLLLVFVIVFITKIFSTNITNIYISGNNCLTDQEIIDMCKLGNYPKSMKNMSFTIKKRLVKNKYISKAKVTKNILLNKIYIDVEENYPLFFYQETGKTMFLTGEEYEGEYSAPILINSVPNEILEELINKMKNIELNILNRISEIEYSPKDSNKDRFIFLMTDGNYVQITLKKMKAKNKYLLNNYLDIIKYIDQNKKGIIKLDSGKYFDEFDD